MMVYVDEPYSPYAQRPKALCMKCIYEYGKHESEAYESCPDCLKVGCLYEWTGKGWREYKPGK